jgi:periplasmic protein TonB
MFEQSVLDNSRRARSKWSWMGLVIQAGLVTAMLLVPMVSPEILSVMLPKAMIYVPIKPVAPVEVEVQQRTGPASNSQNTVAVARPASRRFAAPSAIHPVANIIDTDGYAPPAFTLGPSGVSANSLPFAPTGNALPSAPPPKPEPVKEPTKPHRVGGQVLAASIISRVNPPYPVLAKQARISGSVKLEGIIAKDGTVQQLKVLSGHPLLVTAAIEAVKQWRYRPTHLNGEPVEVIAPIDVNFILN